MKNTNNVSIALVNQNVVDEIRNKLVDPQLSAKDMLDLITETLKAKIPPTQELSENDQLIYNAAIADLAAVQMGRMGETVAKSVRLAVYNMRYSGSYMHVPLDITNMTGDRVLNQETGEIENSYYDSFESWYESFAARAGLNDEYKNTIWNGITRLMSSVRDGHFYEEIPNEDGTSTKRLYSADEVLALDVSKFSKMVVVCNQLQGKLGTDPNVTRQAGELMGMALNPKTSKSKLANRMVEVGISTTRSELIESYEFTAPDGITWCLVRPGTPKQASSWSNISEGRIDKRAATSDQIAQMLGILSRYVDEDEEYIDSEDDPDEEEVDPEELSLWLRGSYSQDQDTETTEVSQEQQDGTSDEYGFASN